MKPSHLSALERSTRGLRRIDRAAARLQRKSARLARLRVLLFLLALGAPIALFWDGRLAYGWSALSFVPGATLYVFVWFLYDRTARAIRRAAEQRKCYERDQLRLAGEWRRDLPAAPPDLRPDANHPYADDLAIHGEFSLGRYGDRTASPPGRKKYYELLLSQPDREACEPDAWRLRTLAIAELQKLRVFRFRWRRAGAPLAQEAGAAADFGWIDAIVRAPRARSAPVVHALAWILPLLSLGSYIGFKMGWNEAWFLLSLPAQAALFLFLHFRLRATAAQLGPYAEALSGLDQLFGVLAGFRMRSERLRSLSIFEPTPAREMRRLASLAGYYSFRRNPLLHFLAGFFLLYDAHLARALAQWQARAAGELARWRDELALVDALQALAGLADADDGFHYAENMDLDGGPAQLILAGDGLAHPLIPPARRVGADFSLEDAQRLWLITGSNMSGKSTFLRSLGLNLTLAMIGAPALAKRFRFRPRTLVSSMNVRDDLAESVSLFYAEVRRIKLLQEYSRRNAPPAFVLIDEMLRGTNARERFIAARGVLAHLQQSAAAGLIATHDMELLEYALSAPGFACYHFQETIADGRMSFDYRLRPGPVESSNALRILEMEGVQL